METENGPVHYWVEGKDKDKECLFFIHGMALTHHIFIPQLDYFKDDYTIILIDVPGHGESRPYKKYSQSECVEMIARIITREGYNQSHIIGESMGGYIAQEFAWTYPEYTQSLSFIGSHPLGKKYYWGIEKFILNHLHHIIALAPYPLIVGTTVAFSGKNKIGKRFTYYSLTQHSKQEIRQISKEVYEDFLSFDEDLPFHSDIPVGAFFGDRDAIGRLKMIGLKWAENRGYYASSIPNAGHNINIDHPSALNQELGYFLTEGLRLMPVSKEEFPTMLLV